MDTPISGALHRDCTGRRHDDEPLARFLPRPTPPPRCTFASARPRGQLQGPKETRRLLLHRPPPSVGSRARAAPCATGYIRAGDAMRLVSPPRPADFCPACSWTGMSDALPISDGSGSDVRRQRSKQSKGQNAPVPLVMSRVSGSDVKEPRARRCEVRRGSFLFPNVNFLT
jgi:hypothetical protein